MIRDDEINELLSMTRDNILSVSLNIDPDDPDHQRANPAYRIWLRNAARDLFQDLPSRTGRQVKAIVARILRRLEDPLKGRGFAVYAAPDFWREFSLPFPLPNRLNYGQPDLLPVLWALDEYEPYGVLAVTRERVRILTVYLGRTSVVGQEVLVLDPSSWRFTSGRQPTFTRMTGTGAARGAQRDTFDARVEEQIRRLWQAAARAAEEFLDQKRIDRLIIAGPEEDVHAVRRELSTKAAAKVFATVPVPSHAALDEIRTRTLPVALGEERRRELALVEEIVTNAAARAGAVVGLTASLVALNRGRARIVVADVHVERDVWYCPRCMEASATEQGTCPVCGTATVRAGLLHVLPLLVRRRGADLELVNGEAAETLRPHEGIGALLRYRFPVVG